MRVSLIIALGALCLQVGTAQENTQGDYTGFIRVSNLSFVDADCRPFYFSGWNGWRLLEYAANRQTPSGYPNGQAFVRELFKKAQQNKFNVLRFFTSGDDGGVALMQSPGVFSEEAFVALDTVLEEARQAGIKLIMVPLNFWKGASSNSVPHFERYCGSDTDNTIPRPDLEIRPERPLNESQRLQTPYKFFTDPGCRQVYKDYLRGIVMRRNTKNGVLYRDDPTILAWNMLNEPRCKFCGPEPVDAWYKDIAQFLKSIDPNHLVTTGEEGFFDETSRFNASNPNDGNRWGTNTGQDFARNHDSPYIDFAVMHLWPDNWKAVNLSFGRSWIDAHVKAAARISKPLVMEEFGKNAESASVRDPWFEMVYATVNDSLAHGGVLRGVLFWQWDGLGGSPGDGGTKVGESDSTFQNYILPYTHRMAAAREEVHKAAGRFVPGCIQVAFNTSAADGASQSTVSKSTINATLAGEGS